MKKNYLTGNTSTMEGWMLRNAEKGEVFYTHKDPKSVTAFAHTYLRSVETEILVVISGTKSNPIATSITRVVLTNDPEMLMAYTINAPYIA